MMYSQSACNSPMVARRPVPSHVHDHDDHSRSCSLDRGNGGDGDEFRFVKDSVIGELTSVMRRGRPGTRQQHQHRHDKYSRGE